MLDWQIYQHQGYKRQEICHIQQKVQTNKEIITKDISGKIDRKWKITKLGQAKMGDLRQLEMNNKMKNKLGLKKLTQNT